MTCNDAGTYYHRGQGQGCKPSHTNTHTFSRRKHSLKNLHIKNIIIMTPSPHFLRGVKEIEVRNRKLPVLLKL